MLLRIVVLGLFCLWPLAAPAAAPDPCQFLPAGAAQAREASQRIAAAACAEHRAWYRPVIETDGRIGSMLVREAVRTPLADGQPAWERVVEYWRGSGLLWQVGAGDCAHGGAAPAHCRAFVVDTPWSAAFVSWVMRRAGVPGFGASPSHLNYVRHAYREPFQSPYRVANPLATPLRVGDMLCYVRGNARVYGFGGLAHVLSGGDPGLGMHCDIVVGITIGSDRTRVAHLVGGNVIDAVTMRRLALSPGDRLQDPPVRQPADPECSPESAYACDLNRQDWAVLLQLRPDAELASLAPALAPAPPVAQPGQSAPGGQGPASTGGSSGQPAPAGRCCNHCDPEVGLPLCPVRDGGR